jgi:methionine-rich copper-binding protein CopC
MLGNLLKGQSIYFSVGTSPTITSTSPSNGATGVSPAKTIAVTFSEAIRKSKNFWVELVDSNGTPVAFTTYITGGNILVINPTSNLAAKTTYRVKISQVIY